MSDVVVEYEPGSGNIVQTWHLTDYFDPHSEASIASLCQNTNQTRFPKLLYEDVADFPRDWTHANAVVLDEARNELLISVRHLDTVPAIRYRDDADGPSGELLWRLGPASELDLVSGGWSYHQHAPEVQADGSIPLYDNGNGRPGSGEAGPASRAVIYQIDDDEATVTQLWEYPTTVDGEPAFAAFVGDADRLDNGNVLITDGGLVQPLGVSAQIVEVVPAGTIGGDVVFQLQVIDGEGWGIYRAERVPALYGWPPCEKDL